MDAAEQVSGAGALRLFAFETSVRFLKGIGNVVQKDNAQDEKRKYQISMWYKSKL